MGAYRQNRINEEIAKSLAEILRNVKEKSVRETVITVTGVSCAPDLSNAKVFYSFFGKGDKKEIAKGLKNATGYIRSQLARTLAAQRSSVELLQAVRQLEKTIEYAQGNVSPAAICGHLAWALR